MKIKRLWLFPLFCAGLSACHGQGFIGTNGELQSDSPGFRRISSDDPSPEAPPGDVSDDPPGSGGDAGGAAGDGGTTGATPTDGPHEAELPAGGDPFADRIVSVAIGDGGGFHQDKLPGIVLGTPRGGGIFRGSFDVLSLGKGGEIVLELTDYIIFDGDGPDFTVFENAFQVGSGADDVFSEPGVIGVSEDGASFVDFPCDFSARPYEGCAGVSPVLVNPDVNALDPRDPAVSGGDSFDLRDLGLKTARFVRIRDSGLGLGPIGSDTRGFDLDAVAVIRGTLP